MSAASPTTLRAGVAGRVDRAVTRLIPYGAIPLPLRDPADDRGLFGPNSMTWRVMREPRLIVGAGRALLLQVAHPAVADAAVGQSTYQQDPFGRLTRTVHWVSSVSFGTVAEAQRSSDMVNAMHARIRGSVPGPDGSPVPYTGMDPLLLQWVHATFVDTMLTVHDALVGGLTSRDRDTFTDEWNRVGALMKVPTDLLWDSHGALTRYVSAMVDSGAVTPSAASRTVADTILAPPLAHAWQRPVWRVGDLAMVGLLPPPIRRGYGLTWTRAHASAHARLCRGLRASAPLLPRQLRFAPVHDFALARVTRGDRA